MEALITECFPPWTFTFTRGKLALVLSISRGVLCMHLYSASRLHFACIHFHLSSREGCGEKKWRLRKEQKFKVAVHT